MRQEVKLFCIKPDTKSEETYYVPAIDYGQAVEKYKEARHEKCGKNAVIRDPDKVTIACDAGHLIMPSNYDIDS